MNLDWKTIDETRNYFVKEINQNELMSRKHKKFCRVLNYIDHLLLLISDTVIRCISISYFASSVGIPIGIASSAVTLKICVIIAGIKKYKSIIKNKKKKHNNIVLLAKSKLNSIEVVIDSNISHDEFFLQNNVLKEFCEMKKKN